MPLINKKKLLTSAQQANCFEKNIENFGRAPLFQSLYG